MISIWNSTAKTIVGSLGAFRIRNWAHLPFPFNDQVFIQLSFSFWPFAYLQTIPDDCDLVSVLELFLRFFLSRLDSMWLYRHLPLELAPLTRFAWIRTHVTNAFGRMIKKQQSTQNAVALGFHLTAIVYYVCIVINWVLSCVFKCFCFLCIY